jgi:hypothetical protein
LTLLYHLHICVCDLVVNGGSIYIGGFDLLRQKSKGGIYVHLFTQQLYLRVEPNSSFIRWKLSMLFKHIYCYLVSDITVFINTCMHYISFETFFIIVLLYMSWYRSRDRRKYWFPLIDRDWLQEIMQKGSIKNYL